MKEFRVKLADAPIAELSKNLKDDGFVLVETTEDGTMVYHQLNESKIKPWTAEDQYKETKKAIRKHYDFGWSSVSRNTSLTPWAFSITVLIGGLLAIAI
jgi:hypothetical protein